MPLRKSYLRISGFINNEEIIRAKQFLSKKSDQINPIPAEVLENQDMRGGGQFDPPPLNPMFNVQI